MLGLHWLIFWSQLKENSVYPKVIVIIAWFLLANAKTNLLLMSRLWNWYVWFFTDFHPAPRGYPQVDIGISMVLYMWCRSKCTSWLQDKLSYLPRLRLITDRTDWQGFPSAAIIYIPFQHWDCHGPRSFLFLHTSLLTLLEILCNVVIGWRSRGLSSVCISVHSWQWFLQCCNEARWCGITCPSCPPQKRKRAHPSCPVLFLGCCLRIASSVKRQHHWASHDVFLFPSRKHFQCRMPFRFQTSPVCTVFSLMGIFQVFSFYFSFSFFPARCGNCSVWHFSATTHK